VVRDLFRIHYRATGSSDKDLRGVLPDVHLDQLEVATDRVARARVVADLISSMTERQLLITHRKLTGTDLGSITDLM
jgi:dGTP triphosphohydrolase